MWGCPNLGSKYLCMLFTHIRWSFNHDHSSTPNSPPLGYCFQGCITNLCWSKHIFLLFNLSKFTGNAPTTRTKLPLKINDLPYLQYWNLLEFNLILERPWYSGKHIKLSTLNPRENEKCCHYPPDNSMLIIGSLTFHTSYVWFVLWREFSVYVQVEAITSKSKVYSTFTSQVHYAKFIERNV